MEAAIHERLHVIDFQIGGIWEVQEEVSFCWAVFAIFLVIIACFRSGLSGIGQYDEKGKKYSHYTAG